MKIFENVTEPGCWSTKVNFVDKNNVVVGFDTAQSCCESAGYVITEDCPPASLDDSTFKDSLVNYDFDQSFIQEHDYIKSKYDSNALDCGGAVSFKLVHNTNKKEIYLTLYNCHNGYYGHGFTFKVNEKVIKQSYL